MSRMTLVIYPCDIILSLFILIYCAILVRYIFQIDFDTYVINISKDNAIDIPV